MTEIEKPIPKNKMKVLLRGCEDNTDVWGHIEIKLFVTDLEVFQTSSEKQNFRFISMLWIYC